MGAIEMDNKLLAEAQAAGINVSQVAEQALAREMERLRQREVIRGEIRRDREALAEYLEKHGDPVAEWNEMFGHPCAT